MMKKIKVSVLVIVSIVAVYCIVSYSIFFLRKSSIDRQLQGTDHSVEDGAEVQKEEKVVIQSMVCTHGQDCYQSELKDSDGIEPTSVQSPEIIITREPEKPLALLLPEPEEEFFIESDVIVPDQKLEESLSGYSFMTMPVTQACIDPETQMTLDVLIGNNVDDFVKLILQSNNDVVSREACRSCGIAAFFNGIKNHKSLTMDEIRILQKLLINLYNFVHKMKSLSDTPIMAPDQCDALEDLHRSQSIKNDIKLKARLAVTSAALKKLQNIKYNK